MAKTAPSNSQIPTNDSPQQLLSIVVPMYDEAHGIPAFRARLTPVIDALDMDVEVICVNDGSKDDTWACLQQVRQEDSRYKIVNLSRNFGKEVALTAGMEHANGDAVIPIDADLQDPPEVIPALIAKWREGYDTVVGVRNDRKKDSFFKRTTAILFYRVLGHMSDVNVIPNGGDFRLLSRRVADAVMQLPEHTRFMKGLFAWVGFRHATVEFAREERAVGQGKWSSWKLWNFALDGVFSFSTLPLRIWTYFGIALALVALSYMVFIIARTLIFGSDLAGYPSLVAMLLFSSGIQFIGIGILGEYIGRIFVEVKGRPLYLTKDREGFDSSTEDASDQPEIRVQMPSGATKSESS